MKKYQITSHFFVFHWTKTYFDNFIFWNWSSFFFRIFIKNFKVVFCFCFLDINDLQYYFFLIKNFDFCSQGRLLGSIRCILNAYVFARLIQKQLCSCNWMVLIIFAIVLHFPQLQFVEFIVLWSDQCFLHHFVTWLCIMHFFIFVLFLN